MGSIPDQAKSHMPQGQKSKTLKRRRRRRSNIVNKFKVKTLKMFHIFKKKKKANTKRRSRDPGTSQGKAPSVCTLK